MQQEDDAEAEKPEPAKPSWKERFVGAVKDSMAGEGDHIDAIVTKHALMCDADSDEEEALREDYGEAEDDRVKKPIVDHPWFNALGGAIVFGNAITIGLETNNLAESASKGIDASTSGWYVIELMFCIVFLLELLLRIYYHRLAYFTSPIGRTWNLVDAAIVVVSVVDTMILVPLGVGGTLQVVSLLRFVRLMRLARLVRLLKLFKELWLMVSGLLQSLKTLGWMCLVSFLLLFASGIVLTTMVGQNDEVYDPYYVESGWDHELYFATVFRSTFTMFQIMTLDQWNETVVRHVATKQPELIIFFLIFVSIAGFGLLSIVVGVVVENTLRTAESDANKEKQKLERDRKHIFSQLQEIFELADADGSGTLTVDEVELAVQKPEIYNKLKMIDFPVDDPASIFALLDYDESGELTTDEFISGCIRMKGGAKSKDLLVAQVAVDAMRKQYGLFEEELSLFREKVARLTEAAASVIDHGEHVFLNERQYRNRHPEFKDANLPIVGENDFELVPWQQEMEEEDVDEEENQLAMLDPPSTANKKRRPAPALPDRSETPKALQNEQQQLQILDGQQGLEDEQADQQLALTNVPGSVSN
eukprot:TRINITY_DN5489_c1_g2_i1.p1 TRINITY_DN5489_c1_g2~~TRINITY_DN5489_c1_g2_i1.p1  ORF type:complete len:590 (-),score=122.10 TRINITY_DN5489_c1_g2_i1:275-2044(-)